MGVFLLTCWYHLNQYVRTQYRTCTVRHLEDVEVDPHPPNVNLDRQSKKTQKSKIRENPTNQDSTSVLLRVLHYFTKKWKRSYGQYAHSGMRVRPKKIKNGKFEKRTMSLKHSSPDSKADFVKKSLFNTWRSILSRYGIILHIYHIILNMQYKYLHIWQSEPFIKFYYIEFPLKNLSGCNCSIMSATKYLVPCTWHKLLAEQATPETRTPRKATTGE